MNEEKKRGSDGQLCWQSRLACKGPERGGIHETVFQTKPKEDRDSGGYPAFVPVLFLASIRGPADWLEIVRWLCGRGWADRLL